MRLNYERAKALQAGQSKFSDAERQLEGLEELGCAVAFTHPRMVARRLARVARGGYV